MPATLSRLVLTDSEWLALRYVRWLGPATTDQVWLDTRLTYRSHLYSLVKLREQGLIELVGKIAGMDAVRVTDEGRDAVDLCKGAV